MPTFVDLPPKLRNRVYDLIIPRDVDYTEVGSEAAIAYIPAIASAYASIRDEILQILRAPNSFTVEVKKPFDSDDNQELLAWSVQSGFKYIQRFTITISIRLPLIPRGMIGYRGDCTVKVRVTGGSYIVEVLTRSRVIESPRSDWHETEQDPHLRGHIILTSWDMVKMAETMLERRLTKASSGGWTCEGLDGQMTKKDL